MTPYKQNEVYEIDGILRGWKIIKVLVKVY
jgi:hypothetical protein